MLSKTNPDTIDRQPSPVRPCAVTRQQQRKILERGHKHHKPVREGDRFGPLGGDTWVRPGAKRVRPDLDGWRLIDAVEWMANRRFVAWTATDKSTIAELEVRCFMFADLERRIVQSRPSWLDGLVREQWITDDGPGLPRSSGFYRFLGDLVNARRSHSVGLLISQPDAAALYDVSDRQFRRWVKHAEAQRIIRVVQTWTEDTHRATAHRCWGKTLYMLGSAVIERAGLALYEGLNLEFKDGTSMVPAAQAAGRRLRREKRTSIRARHDEVWATHKDARARRAQPNHSFKGPDMMSRSALGASETGGGASPQSPPQSTDEIVAPTLSHRSDKSPQVAELQAEVAPSGRISAPSGRVASTRTEFRPQTERSNRERTEFRPQAHAEPAPSRASESPSTIPPVADMAAAAPSREERTAKAAWVSYGADTRAAGLELLRRLGRSGMNAVVVLVLLLATACEGAQNPTASIFFWSCELTPMALNAQNKAEEHENAKHRRGTYNKHTTAQRSRWWALLARPRVVQRPVAGRTNRQNRRAAGQAGTDVRDPDREHERDGRASPAQRGDAARAARTRELARRRELGWMKNDEKRLESG